MNLLDICKIGGNSVKSFEGKKKYVATGDISDNKIIAYETVDYKSKPSRANVVISNNDVIFAKMMDTTKVLKANNSNIDNIYSTGFYCLTPNEKVLQDYLYFYLNSNSFNKQKNKNCSGATQKALNNEGLSKIKIKDIPSINEQKLIVSKLLKIDKLIEIRKKEINNLDKLIKYKFVEMFGDMSEYKLLTYKECTNFVDYRGHTPKVSNFGKIRMINAKSVGKGYFKYIDEYVTKEIYDSWMHRGFGYPGDVLFVTEGHTFGNTCLIPSDLKKFALGQRVITIKGKQMINNVFLNGYMQTKLFMERINVYKTGGTAQGIRSKDLLKVEVPVPPIELQNNFARIVEQIDKQKYEFEKSLKKLEELQAALMQEYFG